MLVYSGTQYRWMGEPINGIRHPRNIEDLWTDAEFAAIGLERYSPAPHDPIDPLTLPITRVQFKAVLRINGLYDQVITAIDAMPDATQKAVAITKFEDSERYVRDDPLFLSMGTALGLTEAEIDAMWLEALEIK